MSISQRKDGRWCVKYKIDTPTGPKWMQRSFSKDKEAEAKAFDAEATYDEPATSRPTLLECVLAFIKEVPHADHTSRCYEWLVMGHDRKDGTHAVGPAEHLADKFADALDRRDLTSFRDAYLAKGTSEATVQLGEQKLKAALTWCASEDLIPINPWAKYRALPAVHGSHQGTLEDFQKVYAYLPEWMRWPCRVAMACCLRPGVAELFRLRWSAFNWRSGTVSIYMPKVNATKTAYLPERFMTEARARYEADGCDGERYVCRNAHGNAVSRDGYRDAWRVACGKAGVKLPFYAIRHISATEMLARGIDLAAVAAQLGHKDLTTTGRHYAHALPSAQKAAAKALPDCTTFGADGAAQTSKM